MNKDFPCKKCHHAAYKHYISIGDGSFPLKFICFTCAQGDRRDWVEINEHLHEFVPDNLKFMELMSKKKDLTDDNNA